MVTVFVLTVERFPVSVIMVTVYVIRDKSYILNVMKTRRGYQKVCRLSFKNKNPLRYINEI